MRSLFIALISVAAIFAGLFVLLLASVHTSHGQRFLAHIAEGIAADANGNGMELERIEVHLDGDIIVPHLKLFDKQGMWLEASDVRGNLDLSALLRNKLHINSLAAGNIAMARMPLEEEASGQTGTTEAEDFAFLLGIREVRLKRLELGEAVTGQRQVLQFNLSQVEDAKIDNRYNLLLTTLEGPPTRLDGSMILGKRFAAKLELEEAPGGIIHAILDLTQEKPLTGDLEAEGRKGTWQGKLDMDYGEQKLLDFSGRLLTKEDGTMHWPELNVFTPGLALNSTGRYVASTRTLVQQSRISSDDLSKLNEFLGTELSGGGTLQLKSNGVIDNTPFNAEFSSEKLSVGGTTLENLNVTTRGTANLPSLTESEPQLAMKNFDARTSLDGKPVEISGAAQLAGNSWLFEPLRINYDGNTGNGFLRLQGEKIEASLDLPRMPVPGMEDALSADATLKTKGTLNNLPLSLSGKLYGLNKAFPELPVAATEPATYSAKAKLSDDGSKLAISELVVNGGSVKLNAKGDVSLSEPIKADGNAILTLAVANNETLTAKSDIDYAGNTVTLSPLTLTGAGSSARGDIKINTDTSLATGALNFDIKQLASLSAFLGESLQGSGSGKVNLTASGGVQGADADATFSSFSGYGLEADKLVVNGRIANVNDISTARGNVTIRDGSYAGYTTGETTVAFTPVDATTVRAELKSSGQFRQQPADLNATALLNNNDGSFAAQITQLKGSAAGKPFSLKAPARFSQTGGGMTLTPATLSLAGGTITAELKQTASNVNGSIRIDTLDADALPLPALLTGSTLSGTVTVSGTPERPVANFDARASYDGLESPLALTATGALNTNALNAKAAFETSEELASANVNLPSRFTLQPFALELRDTAPLTGTIAINAPMEKLEPLLQAHGHHLEGELTGSGSIAGTLAKPVIDLNASMANGDYQNALLGICAKNFTLDIGTRSDSQVTLALDSPGEKPGQSLDVDVSYDLAGSQDLLATAALKDYPLLCGAMASGMVDGNVRAESNAATNLISGDITVSPMNIQLAGGEGQNIPHIPLRVEKAEEKMTPGFDRMALDVGVSLPGRVFVRGRGLDAEFEGNLAVKGTLNAPDIYGTLSTRRGSFTFLDRTLQLSKGNLRFEGKTPPSPYMDIAASTNVDGTTVSLGLSGTAQSPDLDVSSSPPLPNDEALSLFLFGRDVGDISPFQAIQLAQAVRQLAGYSSGPGVIGQATQALGIDTFSVNQDDDENTSVSAGKYITDKVFVGVTEGATEEDREVRTEIELTPDINAEATVDGKGAQGFGVEWKWDY